MFSLFKRKRKGQKLGRGRIARIQIRMGSIAIDSNITRKLSKPEITGKVIP